MHELIAGRCRARTSPRLHRDLHLYRDLADVVVDLRLPTRLRICNSLVAVIQDENNLPV